MKKSIAVVMWFDPELGSIEDQKNGIVVWYKTKGIIVDNILVCGKGMFKPKKHTTSYFCDKVWEKDLEVIFLNLSPYCETTSVWNKVQRVCQLRGLAVRYLNLRKDDEIYEIGDFYSRIKTSDFDFSNKSIKKLEKRAAFKP